MLVEVSDGIKWLLGLGRELTRVTPLFSYGLTSLTFLSQVCLMLAFLLPIKILMLLGTSEVPEYFPRFVADLGHRRLIVLLSITSIAAYLLHASADLLAGIASSRGAERARAAARKINLFGNQSGMAEGAFRRYFTSAASLLFVSASAALLFAVYPLAAFFLLAFVSMSGVAMVAASSFSVRVRDNLHRNFKAWVDAEAGLGSMLLFALLVIDILAGASHGVIAAVVALILGRQALKRLANAARDVFLLYRDRERLSAIFFRRRVLDGDAKGETSDLWPLLMPDRRDQWVAGIVRDLIPAEACPAVRGRWWELGRSGVIGLLCERSGAAPLLLKIFSPAQRLAAAHEAHLLAARLTTLPAPPLLGVSEFRGHRVHLLGLGAAVERPDGNSGALALQIQKDLASIAPPKDLQDRFARSRPMLWDRLSKLRLERVGVATEGREDREALDVLLRSHEMIARELRQAPLAIMNPDRTLNNMIRIGDGRLALLNWGSWSIEPVGSGFDPDYVAEQLAEVLRVSSTAVAPESDEVDRYRAVLAASAYEMDRLCSQQAFSEALRLIPTLLRSAELVRKCKGNATLPVL